MPSAPRITRKCLEISLDGEAYNVRQYGKELEDKFRSLASRAPSYGQTEACIDAVWALEASDDVSELMALAVPNV